MSFYRKMLYMNSKIFLLITLLLGHELVNAQLVETSTFDPLSISDKTFVIDDGPDLDECVFNVGSTGPNSQGWPVSRTNDALEIDVVIDRYVGEVDSDGFLVNPQHLIDRGLISSEAVIRVASKRPALDSRSSAIRPVIYDPSFTAPSDTPVTPQVSRVYLHRGTAKEKVVGDLKGEFSSVQINNREFWYVNEFKVDISDLKFPHYVNDSFGSRLTGPSSNFPNANMVPAKNTLSVTVDELNVNSPYYHWCMAVDWISVSIDAQSPIALIHGTAAQSSTWDVPEDDNFVEHLSDAGIPFYYKIDLEPNGSIDGNAMLLKQELRKAGVFYGVDSLHLVAHSKGGIDSRRYLSSPYYTPAADIEPQVVSLTTLSTPHDGTVLADLTQIYTNLGKASTSNASIESFLSTEVPSRVLAAIGRVPGGDAVRDLQTMEMASFNRNNILPSNVKMYTIGADADLDESNTIEERENKLTIY